MPTKVIDKKGNVVYLEKSEERASRYARELKQGSKLSTGEVLTPAQAGYRMGVLAERTTSAKIYNKKNGLPGKGKSKVKK